MPQLLAVILSLNLMLPTWAQEAPVPTPSPSHRASKPTASEQILSEEFPIPKIHDAPPSLGRKIPEAPKFPCYRQYMIQGRPLGCDSYLAHDGENLRPFLQQVPAALDQLNQYQETRRSLKMHAYLGSIGLIVFFSGFFVSKSLFPDDKQKPGLAGKLIPYLPMIPGAAFALGNGMYAFFTLQANETRLSNAVQMYNEARPGNPIELQFSTGWRF